MLIDENYLNVFLLFFFLCLGLLKEIFQLTFNLLLLLSLIIFLYPSCKYVWKWEKNIKAKKANNEGKREKEKKKQSRKDKNAHLLPTQVLLFDIVSSTPQIFKKYKLVYIWPVGNGPNLDQHFSETGLNTYWIRFHKYLPIPKSAIHGFWPDVFLTKSM